ncbi:MAG TPA: DUF6596 domain-containing protein [Polyangiaceae bacterium]|nr:DUF6596 domain-containing protein [Polyangiaceae bacterium]
MTTSRAEERAAEPRAAWGAVERAARGAYGRLVANLAYRFHDIAAAEDALGDALKAALEQWPSSGLPASPEAWLMAVAKNQLRQGARHRTMAQAPETRSAVAAIEAALGEARLASAGDERLALLFVCAHPAIDPSLRAPLMLQTVLGVDVARIAASFLVTPAAMNQRLVRGKQKIRDAGVPFEPPTGGDLVARLESVLEGIYAAFGAGWDDAGAGTPSAEPLDEEALFLAGLLAEQLRSEPEPLGLLALMTFSRARRGARFDGRGAFVPLAEHDTSRWDRAAILEADRLLLRAASFRRPGPYQLEAAIQSAHCQRLFSGRTPWAAIATLYDYLTRAAPSVASRVAHVAALAEAGRVEEARDALAAVDRAQAAAYAPYWVVAAHLAKLAGDREARQSALGRAIELTRDERLRAYLERQRSLGDPPAG